MSAEPANLRERKRLRARRDLQRAAVRLVEERGYGATTIDDICAAAEVSKSSFFRYFGGKEAVFGADLVEESVAASWEAPRERTLDELRDMITATYHDLSAEDYDLERRRIAILQSVPELRASFAAEVLRPFPLIVRHVAAMLGLPADSVPVRTMAGAVFGVIGGRYLPIDGGTVELPATAAAAEAEFREAFDEFAALAPRLLSSHDG